jgi:hypothetical protein
MRHSTREARWATLVFAPLALLAVSCGGSDGGEAIGETTSALSVEVECVDAADALPEAAWICPEERVVECRSRLVPEAVETLFVVPEAATCDEVTLSTGGGPYGVGEHPIEVEAARDGAVSSVCLSTLRVVDTVPPEAGSHDAELWPPNHALHRVSVSDCVTAVDACDPAVATRFRWVASDEPDEGIGDGAHAGDMDFVSCSEVLLRAERQGGGNGRVYTLGWRAEDEAGNGTEGTCQVSVPHDQSRPAVRDSVHREVTAPTCAVP